MSGRIGIRNALELLEKELSMAYAYDSEGSSDYMIGLRTGLAKAIKIVELNIRDKK